MFTRTKNKASGDFASGPERPRAEWMETGGGASIALSGRWTTQTVGLVDAAVRELESRAGSGQSVQIDASGVTGIDTSGAWLAKRLAEAFRAAGATVSLRNFSVAGETLLDAVDEALAEGGETTPPKKRDNWAIRTLINLGKATYAMRRDMAMSMHILGAAVYGAQLRFDRRRPFSLAPLIHQIDRIGVRAIPIITLMSVIIGAIIAQQGAFQLKYFGADIFVVDLVSILVLREIGVLLTAIMIAGRSGSAITAEIGSMKMREEVDALTVIGLNPIGVLVFPRLMALVISLPLLAFIANIAALGGAMVVCAVYSNISPDAFIARMRDA
nr:ABC transporter permease [Rhizobiaceae bacterium]